MRRIDVAMDRPSLRETNRVPTLAVFPKGGGDPAARFGTMVVDEDSGDV